MIVKLAIVPSPRRSTGCHAFAWQAGHSCRGGIATAPREPHLRAVSWPARTRSKKARAVIGDSVAAKETHQHRCGVAPERMGEPGLGAVDLARAGLAADLRDDLGDLRRAGCADRMPLRLQAAGGVDGNLAAEARATRLGRPAAGARLEEAETFGGDDLGDREAGVQVPDVHVPPGPARPR